MQKRVVEVVAYDPQWVAAYRAESTAIEWALNGLDLRLHHIGSTSVPGLMAKPVIDLLIETPDVTELDAHDDAMQGLGYVPRGEFGIPGRRFYLKGLYHRTDHIHAFNRSTLAVLRHLAFRDDLIAHPDVATDYGIFKSTMVTTCAFSCSREA